MSAKGRILAATLLMLFPASYPAIGATIGFKPAANYAVGTAPKAVAVADFNQDGHVDLAVANNGGTDDDGNASILLGNGDGTFQAAVNYPAGKNPTAVAVGDFNGDGRKDLLVASSSSPTVSVLLGNGDGTLQAPVDYPAGPAGLYTFRGLVVGDFNGDSRLDLAVVSSGLNQPITVLVGNGDGSFQTAVDYAVAGFPSGLAAADLNGDGHLDLAVALGLAPPGTPRGVAILLGTGNGSFIGGTLVSAGSSVGVVAGDLTGDGHPDLVVEKLNFHPDFSLFLNNGDGTFGSGNSLNVGDVVGDFDGDGKLDLAGFTEDCTSIFNPCTNQRLAVLPGNGNGTFQPEVSFPGNTHPSLAADLDGNKSPDLLTVDSAANAIGVLLNTVGTEFSISASAASPATVSRGQSSTSTVTLHLLNAFDNPVALTCSVQTAQAAPTCSVNPNSVTFDASGNATAMLTINTGATAASLAVPSPLRDSQPPQFLWLPVAGFVLVGVGLGRGGARRRTLLNLLASGIVLTGLMLGTGCGGRGSSSVHTTPPLSTYTITVTGTSGSTQHSTTVTLKVQ